MNRDSEDYKRGYKDSALDLLVILFVSPLLVFVFGGLCFVLLWLLGKVMPDFNSRSLQTQTNFVLFVFLTVLGIIALAIWKLKAGVPNSIDKEREAEIFYGFRKPEDKE